MREHVGKKNSLREQVMKGGGKWSLREENLLRTDREENSFREQVVEENSLREQVVEENSLRK